MIKQVSLLSIRAAIPVAMDQTVAMSDGSGPHEKSNVQDMLSTCIHTPAGGCENSVGA